MREYNSRPENRAKKQERDRRYAAVHRDQALERATSHYWANRPAKLQYLACRSRDAKIAAVLVKGGQCEICGFDLHPAALQFHHREPSEKNFTVSVRELTRASRSEEEILAELDKCDLVCANCHFMLESTWDLEGVWKDEDEV